MDNQNWDAAQYQKNASFVARLGEPVLELLNPQPGESILDVGCGDGALTERIARAGSEVVGIDSSQSMITAARERGLNARLVSADAMSFRDEFDAVFTNAALHWISDYQSVITGVSRALKSNGRFVGEFGGHGNIATLTAAMEAVVTRNPGMGGFENPWFFPTDDEYRMHLEAAGFVVNYIELIPRPTPLESGVREWLKVFANHVIARLPQHLQNEFLDEIERIVRPVLYSASTGWQADYVRLRFSAVKA